jgi:hypothetical protein
MAFQGSLKELPLPDIIQLVSVSGKTGKFTLAHEHDRGLIYLKNGQIVHAELNDVVGEEAIYTLAIWNQGDFQFTAGEEPARQTISKSNTNLLMEAARRLDEWRVLSKKIPSVDAVPVLQVRANRHEQITLNAQEWLLVTKIDGRSSIAEVAAQLNTSAFEVAKVLYGMVTAELVTLKKKPERAVAGAGDGLAGLAEKIRLVAENYVGEPGHRSIDRHFRIAVAAIEQGEGENAITRMVEEFEKTVSLLRGGDVSAQMCADISLLTTHH